LCAGAVDLLHRGAPCGLWECDSVSDVESDGQGRGGLYAGRPGRRDRRRVRPATRLGFSSTPRPGMMAGNDGVCPTSRGGSAPEQRPTAPTSAVAIREDATPPAPCLTRPHGRAEGSAHCFLGSRCRAVSLLNLPMRAPRDGVGRWTRPRRSACCRVGRGRRENRGPFSRGFGPPFALTHLLQWNHNLFLQIKLRHFL
jgi:hypothetical protein